MEKIRLCYLGELVRTPDAMDHLGIRQGLESYESLIVDPVLNPPDVAARLVADFKPDLVIHGNTDSLGQFLAGKIRELCDTKQAFWMLDYQPHEELYQWQNWETTNYDAIFLSNKSQLEMWSRRFKCPTYYLTHGCVVQPLVRDHNFYHKCVFIGSMTDGGWYKDRFDLLKELEFDLITGDGVEGRNQVWRDMPAIYHTADCVIDISHSWTADGYASGRYFYTAGLGACSITKRFPGCEELYPITCKAYFDTPEEASELIEYYSTHEKEREEMKLKAWEWNRDHHHYKLKFKEIISKVCD